MRAPMWPTVRWTWSITNSVIFLPRNSECGIHSLRVSELAEWYMRPFSTSKDLWSLGCVRIFLNILSEAYAFRQSFSRFGRFLSPEVVSQVNGMTLSLAADEATVRSPLPVLLGCVFSGLDSSCWGGTILSASWWRCSSTSLIVLARVTAAKWNISRSTRRSSVRSSPSLSSSRSTVDRSSSRALLFGFSNNRDRASALRFCDPGM